MAMKTIWKYVLSQEIELDMPYGAQILSVREQGEDLCLWALLDPKAPTTKRRFAVYGTGWDVLPGAMQYIGTGHLRGGALVFHVFELLD
jgi:hypothetical protein